MSKRPPEPLPLQWGRGLTTAESDTRCALANQPVSPSMGPRSYDRGEAPTAGRARRGVSPFNGAAVLRPRRAPPRWLREAIAEFLQWGRGLTTAESRRACAARTETRPPSMGPRSYDRGESTQGDSMPSRLPSFNGAAVLRPRRAPIRAATSPSKAALQWGRGLTTAESWRMPSDA